MLDARRRACLQAMGIDLWQPFAEATAAAEPEPAALEQPSVVERSSASASAADSDAAATQHAPPWLDEAPPMMDEMPPMADTLWPDEEAPAEVDLPALQPDQRDWPELSTAVASCTACELHKTRTKTVFGVGDRQANLLVIGEAPGGDEDRQGEPFVGRAGQLLTAMLAAIDLPREQVYIANIIKCRPPGNRDPHAEEAAACQAFLLRQIALIQPQLILSVGRVSAHNLLGTDVSVGRLRGRTHRFDPGDIPLVVTYHPAYLLRRPQEKAKVWKDLQDVHRLLHAG